MGSQLDALKLVSWLTLFESVAANLAAGSPAPTLGRIATLATEVLDAAAAQELPRCTFTQARL